MINSVSIVLSHYDRRYGYYPDKRLPVIATKVSDGLYRRCVFWQLGFEALALNIVAPIRRHHGVSQ